MKKTIFLLNIDDFEPEITRITYPYIHHYAQKIHAEVVTICDRKFPDFPVTYEKLQIYELAAKFPSDWYIYIDSDAMVHPDTPDFTQLIPRDTVMHVGCDFAPIRWRYDKFFQRDGRNFGSCNWFTIASDLCTDLWKPLDDLTLAEALDNIFPISDELLSAITRDHLIDDYVLSRNIAKYGLKTVVFKTLKEKYGIPGDYFWHEYLMKPEEKLENIKRVRAYWQLNEKDRKKMMEEGNNGNNNQNI